MNWKLCVTDPQKRALDFCHGSMDEGDGVGAGNGYSSSDGLGGGRGSGGDGNGDGYGAHTGNGFSPAEWE